MRAQFSTQTLKTVSAAETERDAFAAFADYAGQMGADLISYHHNILPQAGQTRFSLMSEGFPADWVERYRTSNFNKIDPITSYAAIRTRPFLWMDVEELVSLTTEQMDYLAALKHWLGAGDGLAIPLFGPSCNHGYAGIGWLDARDRPDHDTICVLQAMSECVHLRICELRLSGQALDFKLTDIQHRLLRALATGQPDELICGMVNLRPDALQSAITRLLRTMGVSDRASALIRAKGLGLIER